MTRLAVLRNSATPTGPAQFGIIQAMAPSLKVEVSPINVRDAAEIERGINAFARSSNDGLIVTPGGPAARHRDLIVALAADIICPRSTSNAPSSTSAAWFPTELTTSISSVARRATSIASSKVRSPPICPSRPRPSTSW